MGSLGYNSRRKTRIRNTQLGFRPLEEWTWHLTTRADDSHAPPEDRFSHDHHIIGFDKHQLLKCFEVQKQF